MLGVFHLAGHSFGHQHVHVRGVGGGNGGEFHVIHEDILLLLMRLLCRQLVPLEGQAIQRHGRHLANAKDEDEQGAVGEYSFGGNPLVGSVATRSRVVHLSGI